MFGYNVFYIPIFTNRVARMYNMHTHEYTSIYITAFTALYSQCTYNFIYIHKFEINHKCYFIVREHVTLVREINRTG